MSGCFFTKEGEKKFFKKNLKDDIVWNVATYILVNKYHHYR